MALNDGFTTDLLARTTIEIYTVGGTLLFQETLQMNTPFTVNRSSQRLAFKLQKVGMFLSTVYVSFGSLLRGKMKSCGSLRSVVYKSSLKRIMNDGRTQAISPLAWCV